MSVNVSEEQLDVLFLLQSTPGRDHLLIANALRVDEDQAREQCKELATVGLCSYESSGLYLTALGEDVLRNPPSECLSVSDRVRVDRLCSEYLSELKTLVRVLGV